MTRVCPIVTNFRKVTLCAMGSWWGRLYRSQSCARLISLHIKPLVSKGGDWNKIGRMPLPARVNGDDILFKANMDFYENFWKPAVAAIGFTLSPGKNYIASKFLTVNSEAWRPLNNCRFEKICYLNTGLVYSGPNGSMRPPLRLSHAEMPWTGKFDEALKGCINKHRTLGRLLHYYRGRM